MKLEALLTSPAGFGLTTASAWQRAVCRVLDGTPLGDLATPDVLATFGVDDVAALPSDPPREVYLLASVRAAKSMLAAAEAVRAALTVEVGHLKPGDEVRVSIVSITTDLARVVYSHLVGALQSSPALRALQTREPTADTVFLRHASGREVEVKCVAGSRAGASLVARWSAGAIFDEFPRMLGADDASVNFDDARRAVLGRLLPGARLVAIGSPWAPMGPAFDVFRAHFGKPTRSLVVVRAPGWVANPAWWTPERCAELRSSDPVAFETDVAANFADPESGLLASSEVVAVTRAEPAELPPYAGVAYACAIDPATRGNAFTLVLVQVDDPTSPAARPIASVSSLVFDPLRPSPRAAEQTGPRRPFRVALVRQWIGSKLSPLSPDAVFREIATLVRPFGVRRVLQDQASADANRDLARRYGLDLTAIPTTAANRTAMYEEMRVLIATGQIELPPDPTLRADLLSIRKRPTANGVQIVLPQTSNGRHADYAPALALACANRTAVAYARAGFAEGPQAFRARWGAP